MIDNTAALKITQLDQFILGYFDKKEPGNCIIQYLLIRKEFVRKVDNNGAQDVSLLCWSYFYN